MQLQEGIIRSILMQLYSELNEMQEANITADFLAVEERTGERDVMNAAAREARERIQELEGRHVAELKELTAVIDAVNRARILETEELLHELERLRSQLEQTSEERDNAFETARQMKDRFQSKLQELSQNFQTQTTKSSAEYEDIIRHQAKTLLCYQGEINEMRSTVMVCFLEI